MRPEMQERVRACEEHLDIEFQNPLLLLEALTHRSYLNEDLDHPTGHNERLEFLGDAVVELVVTDFLFRKFPDLSEGELTDRRASLVNATTMANIIQSQDLLKLMLFARGQQRENSEDTAYGKKAVVLISADLFEALVGAIYLDQGLGACRLFLDHFLLRHTKKLATGELDDKTWIQNESQRRFGATPTYPAITHDGKEHDRRWTVALHIHDIEVARATAPNKKEAQSAAAKQARETITQWEGRIAEAVRRVPRWAAPEKGRGQ